MRVLTLRQPWASLIALGHKKIETRSWRTDYRGPLLIHAAKTFSSEERLFASEERSFGRIGARLPLQAIVCKAVLVDCQPTEEASLTASGLEKRLGNFLPRRFAWFLEHVEPLTEPVPCIGCLGLWKPSADVLESVEQVIFAKGV